MLSRSGCSPVFLPGVPALKPEPEELYQAAEDGDIDKVTRLLKAGVDPNRGYESDVATPLCVAAAEGHVDIVCELIRYTADTSKALSVAVMEGQDAVVAQFIRAGAQPGSEDLVNAVHFKYLAVVRVLLENGADPDSASSDGTSALIVAVEGNSLSIVQDLLAKGANVNAEDPYGVTALGYACHRNYEDMVLLLEANGAEIRSLYKKDWRSMPTTPERFLSYHLAIDISNESVFSGLHKKFYHPLPLRTLALRKVAQCADSRRINDLPLPQGLRVEIGDLKFHRVTVPVDGQWGK